MNDASVHPARLKLGCIALSVWSGLNLCVGLAVTVALLLGHNAPALSYNLSEAEVTALDHKALAVVNGLAHLANPLIVALCALVLFVTWNAVAKGVRWGWWAVVVSLVPIQAF